MKGLLCF